MNSKLGDYLDNVIYPRLDRELVFQQLNPVRKGEIINADCPSCRKAGKAWIKSSGHQLVCWSCNYSIRILAYVAGTDAPRGKDFANALEKLAAMAGVPSPEQALPPAVFRQIRIESARASTFDQILTICREALDSPWDADDARNYLEKRNFNIGQHPLGWLESAKALSSVIKPDNLVDCGLAELDEDTKAIRFKWRKRVIGPLVDRHGRILGFWGRSLDEENNPPKYRWTTGATVATSGAYGLGEANLNSVVLVEGVLDIFKARQHGIYNMAAFAGTGSQNRWEALHKIWKIREATLLFDNDEPGQKATMAALEGAFKNAKKMTLWVVPPWCLGECKDPDEYLDKFGGEALKALIAKNKVSASEFYAKAVLNGWGY